MTETTIAEVNELNELWESSTLVGLKRDIIDLESNLDYLGRQSLSLLNEDVECYENDPDLDQPVIQLLNMSQRLYRLKEYAKHGFEADLISSLPEGTIELTSEENEETKAA